MKTVFYTSALLSICLQLQAVDTDGDGLTDSSELEIHHTDPQVADTDGDGLGDGFEIGYGRFFIADELGLSWGDSIAASQSADWHLATVTAEAEWNSIIEKFSERKAAEALNLWIGGRRNENGQIEWVTGESYSIEVLNDNIAGERFLLWHRDGRVVDAEDFSNPKTSYLGEFGYPTDPTNADTDGDGVSDGVEHDALTNPLDPRSKPIADGSSPYKLITGAFSWDEAKADAEARGGHLATITTEFEQKQIEWWLNNNTSFPHAFIGASFDEETDDWEWITGEPWGYENWGWNQPRFSDDLPKGDQHLIVNGGKETLGSSRPRPVSAPDGVAMATREASAHRNQGSKYFIFLWRRVGEELLLIYYSDIC